MNIAIGRPPDLGFMRRLDVILAWDEHYHSLVGREAASKYIALRLRVLSRKIARLRAGANAPYGAASGAPYHEIARLSREMDKLGRFHRVLLYKPATPKPVIDRKIAKRFGITERMVRKIRDDRSMDPFRSQPPWEVRGWERAALQDLAARQLARKLMTPERLAKCEPVRIYSGGLQVPFRVGMEWEIIPGPAPKGARCSFISPLLRMPTNQEARAQRNLRAFEAKVAEWKKSLE